MESSLGTAKIVDNTNENDVPQILSLSALLQNGNLPSSAKMNGKNFLLSM